LECLKVRNQSGMNKIILSVIVIFLLPISVFGFDWTVSYDMKKSDGRIEYLELSVPKVIKGLWELPNLEGNWTCWLGMKHIVMLVYNVVQKKMN